MDRVKAAFAASVASAALLAPAAPSVAAVAFDIADGSAVSSPVHVEMGVRGYAIWPASEGVVPGTGHFHIIVDRDPSEALEEGDVIPFDATHLHYGKGQTDADLKLSLGRHTLSLQFADALHRSYGASERQDITITVQ